MPFVSPLQNLVMPGFGGGVNRDADPYQLELNESPDAENVNFGAQGAVSKRKGYNAWDTGVTTPCRRLVTWTAVGGSEYMFHVNQGGTIHFGTSSPLAPAAAGVGTIGTDLMDYPVAAASMEDKLYFTAVGAAAVRRWDGSAWANITLTTFDGTSSRYPAAAHTVVHHNRVFAGNVMNGATAEPSALYWSDALDAETWQASSVIQVTPDDGQVITGLVPLGESLLIFKNHSVYILTGKSEASFTLLKLDPQVGCESPYTLVTQSGRLIFFDAYSGVWAFDGAGFTQLDTKINEYLLDGITWANRNEAAAFIWKNKYYLSVPWSSNAYNSRTFVLDLRTGSWTEYTYGCPDFTTFGGNVLYGGSPNNNTGVYQLETGSQDDPAGTPTNFTAYFKTPWITPSDSPLQKHRLRRVDSTWSAIGDFDVTMNVYRDFNTTAIYTNTIDTDPGGATLDEIADRQTAVAGKRWRALQLEFKTTGNQQWQLNRLGLTVSSLERIKGID